MNTPPPVGSSDEILVPRFDLTPEADRPWPAEESTLRALWQRLGAVARRGDRDARDRLVRANLRLVVAVARRFAGRGLATDDLVGEGNLGLIRAATAYDPDFGTRFSTYAAYWIKEAIGRALMNT